MKDLGILKIRCFMNTQNIWRLTVIFLRDAILNGTISTNYVSTTDQLADIFTKTVRESQFEFLLSKLGIHDLHAPT
ncbi:hypothetical protein LIER_34881 [Lithospermum erythrorhizon]|uniref:Uncharacterized protein n=1 Tax=Lithospermum erythrorhizon TaxID=34254 RepID=A0AAV3S0U1_LITER